MQLVEIIKVYQRGVKVMYPTRQPTLVGFLSLEAVTQMTQCPDSVLNDIENDQVRFEILMGLTAVTWHLLVIAEHFTLPLLRSDYLALR